MRSKTTPLDSLPVQPAAPEMSGLKVIINCDSTEFLDKSLNSLLSQAKQDWKAFITLDCCSEDDLKQTMRFIGGDCRIQVALNLERKFSMRNQIDAIARSGSSPEDVIVTLDGDDWFATDSALHIIESAYQSGAWMTYGSWFSPPDSLWGTGMWPAYPEGVTDFRHHRWLATAVRTWKRWLWDKIKDESLRDNEGQYFRIAEDRAIMYPLLEMCGLEHAIHVPEPLMFYNQHEVYSEVRSQEALRNVTILQGRQAYDRIAHAVPAA